MVREAMAKDPVVGYATAQELAEDLESPDPTIEDWRRLRGLNREFGLTLPRSGLGYLIAESLTAVGRALGP